ncbi:hypothetical protein JGH11_02960 [Dysgonomonas sp. Marseille-P4677]|uniref:hypothetical protein n=1 Tax=Dysgonomonas sp. Marseille-P4677 TaxID=2364790 RepID=UPI001911D16E|nr:hypothetical protein [Dysgonomonas sp. Marseille-P4677]MBK5719827.1 hypothetical protein [Dysgonomonas sp. Marseille-P4677]
MDLGNNLKVEVATVKNNYAGSKSVITKLMENSEKMETIPVLTSSSMQLLVKVMNIRFLGITY